MTSLNYLTIDRLHRVTFPCFLKARVADPGLIIISQTEKANLKETVSHSYVIYTITIATVKSSIVDRFTKINNSLQVFANLQKCGKIKFIRFVRFL